MWIFVIIFVYFVKNKKSKKVRVRSDGKIVTELLRPIKFVKMNQKTKSMALI